MQTAHQKQQPFIMSVEGLVNHKGGSNYTSGQTEFHWSTIEKFSGVFLLLAIFCTGSDPLHV